MRITWVTRSFLDYRIPVFQALDSLCGGQLTVIYNGDVVPLRCQNKLKQAIGTRAVDMHGEMRIGRRHQLGVANKGIRIPIQKGLLKKIRETNPDVIVSDGFFQWTYAPLILRMQKWNNVSHVMCYEKTRHTERNAPQWRIRYRRFVTKWIDAIDCNGQLCEKFVREVIKFQKTITHGHMTADTSGMAANVKAASDADVNAMINRYNLQGLTFIYVGRLIPLKGLMQLLRAWKDAALTDATLMLVGEGQQQEEIESYIRQNNITNVKLTGAVNYDDLGPYYKAADCFIIPTLEDNWSLVVPEAMASGLPIACSIYNGCHPELVKPENGWTFDPLDLDNTVATLRSISDSREKLAEMGAASKKIVSNHTPQHAAQGIYNACLKVLKK